AAEGHDGALEGLVGLQAYDLLEVLVDIAGGMGRDVGDDLGVKIEDAAGGALLLHQVQDLLPELFGALGGAGQEAAVPVVGGVVFLNEFADVDCVHTETSCSW